MHINWSHYLALNESSILDFSQHVLLVFVDALPVPMPFHTSLENKLKRSQSTLKDIEEKPVSLELADGALISMVQLKTAQSVFEQQTLLRQALKPLLAERRASHRFRCKVGRICRASECSEFTCLKARR